MSVRSAKQRYHRIEEKKARAPVVCCGFKPPALRERFQNQQQSERLHLAIWSVTLRPGLNIHLTAPDLKNVILCTETKKIQ